MLGGFIGGLIVAWILSLFEVNNMIIEVIQSFNLPFDFTMSHYYIAFGLIGLIGGAFSSN